MRVFRRRDLRRFDREPAAHSQMNVKTIPVVQREHNALAAAFDRFDFAVSKLAGEINLGWRDDIRAKQSHATNRALNKLRRERIDDGLDFRKLWHSAI